MVGNLKLVRSSQGAGLVIDRTICLPSR